MSENGFWGGHSDFDPLGYGGLFAAAVDSMESVSPVVT